MSHVPPTPKDVEIVVSNPRKLIDQRRQKMIQATINFKLTQRARAAQHKAKRKAEKRARKSKARNR